MTHDDKPTSIDQRTWVPLAGAVGAIMLLLGAMAWLDNRFQAVAVDIADTKDRVTSISHELERMSDRFSDRWTASQMKVWELELRRRNPTLDLPDAWAIVNGAGPKSR